MFIQFRTLILTLVLVSCSTAPVAKSLDQKMALEEVRSLGQIREHSRLLLDSHPELAPAAKEKIKDKLDFVIQRQQDLRDEESKIIQLLLSKSFRVNDLSIQEGREREQLKKRLYQVYSDKSQNIYSLASLIIEMTAKEETSKEFTTDSLILFRDLR